jgi:hypothetical protein
MPYVMPDDGVRLGRFVKRDLKHACTVKVVPDGVLHGQYSEYLEYVQSLKSLGLKVDFDYDFIFLVEKRNRFLDKNKELIALAIPSRVLNILDEIGIHTVKEL